MGLTFNDWAALLHPGNPLVGTAAEKLLCTGVVELLWDDPGTTGYELSSDGESERKWPEGPLVVTSRLPSSPNLLLWPSPWYCTCIPDMFDGGTLINP